MKKKFSVLLCILTLVLSLTGCVEKEAVAYDEAALQASCEQVVYLVASESIPAEQLESMSEWNQGYFLASLESQIGVQTDMDALMTAIKGWSAAQEECGQFIQYGEFTFEASTTGVTATVPATFSDREADLEFVFDEELKMESFTVSAKYETGEILKKAGLNTLLGMGTVFAVLIFMSFIISLMKYLPALLNRKNKKETAQAVEENTAQAQEVSEEAYVDDTELIAVIAAAIVAAEGTSTDGFVVRSIKRRKSNKWNA